MNKSMIAGLCATAAVFVSGAASAANYPYRPEPLPPLYVSAALAQTACPADEVVWVNWTLRVSHDRADKFYGHTVGAYACAADSAKAGIKPAL